MYLYFLSCAKQKQIDGNRGRLLKDIGRSVSGTPENKYIVSCLKGGLINEMTIYLSPLNKAKYSHR